MSPLELHISGLRQEPNVYLNGIPCHRLFAPVEAARCPHSERPALYLTAVAKDRLPVFRTDAINLIACAALDEARRSGGFSFYAYIVMPDHLHAITDGFLKPSTILRYINGIISRRVIDHLKDHGHNASLQKLKHETKERLSLFPLGPS